MSQINLLISIFLLTCIVGCNRATGPEEYTYRYSMESINNFKIALQLNPDSTYQVRRHNFFFDKYDDKKSTQSKNGTLTRDEFDTFIKLIGDSKLDKMEDTYGFDHQGAAENNIVCTVELIRDEKSKFVVVNMGVDEHFPDNFNRLIAFSGDFINAKLNE